MFTNLLSNAIKYNRPGGHVSVVVEPLGASKVQISLEDSGVGMSASQLDQLFQPFNRVGAEKTVVEGTGLGLVIARELTQGMGGTIEVTSTPQAGSCFTVKLPLAKSSPGAAFKPSKTCSNWPETKRLRRSAISSPRPA